MIGQKAKTSFVSNVFENKLKQTEKGINENQNKTIGKNDQNK